MCMMYTYTSNWVNPTGLSIDVKVCPGLSWDIQLRHVETLVIRIIKPYQTANISILCWFLPPTCMSDLFILGVGRSLGKSECNQSTASTVDDKTASQVWGLDPHVAVRERCVDDLGILEYHSKCSKTKLHHPYSWSFLRMDSWKDSHNSDQAQPPKPV